MNGHIQWCAQCSAMMHDSYIYAVVYTWHMPMSFTVQSIYILCLCRTNFLVIGPNDNKQCLLQ